LVHGKKTKFCMPDIDLISQCQRRNEITFNFVNRKSKVGKRRSHSIAPRPSPEGGKRTSSDLARFRTTSAMNSPAVQHLEPICKRGGSSVARLRGGAVSVRKSIPFFPKLFQTPPLVHSESLSGVPLSSSPIPIGLARNRLFFDAVDEGGVSKGYVKEHRQREIDAYERLLQLL